MAIIKALKHKSHNTIIVPAAVTGGIHTGVVLIPGDHPRRPEAGSVKGYNPNNYEDVELDVITTVLND